MTFIFKVIVHIIKIFYVYLKKEYMFNNYQNTVKVTQNKGILWYYFMIILYYEKVHEPSFMGNTSR